MKKNGIAPARIIGAIASLLVCAAGSALYINKALSSLKVEKPASMSQQQRDELQLAIEVWNAGDPIVSKIQRETAGSTDIDIWAKSAIIIDAKTGSIVFEQNADEEIPPASMTKLVEMYVVYEAINSGDVSLDDIVPLPPESWVENIPWDASRMGLSRGHVVTLNELLLGLAICSGNDASIAVANYVAGDMDSFVKRMNKVVEDMGLTHTHFVESSGYSELNYTTAKEFVAFCRKYVEKYPWAITNYHSQQKITYPQEHNLPPELQYMGNGLAYTQQNTNKLLGALAGCDGLKTGYIDESGYNLALTCEREDTRFISVTMGGPGQGTAQGNRFRNADGRTLMEFAFKNYADYVAPTGKNEHKFIIPVIGSEEDAVYLVPGKSETFTVPFITGDSAKASAKAVNATFELPAFIQGKAVVGQQYGTITYSIGKNTLRTLPLIADRSTKELRGLAKARETGFALVVNAFHKKSED